MKSFWNLFQVFLISSVVVLGCGKGSGTSGQTGDGNSNKTTAENKILKPDGTLNVDENADDTDARIEDFAKHCNIPVDVAFDHWNKYKEKTGVTSLKDIDFNSEKSLGAFIFGFVARSDVELGFIIRKIFGSDKDQKDQVVETIIRRFDKDSILVNFQSRYGAIVYGTYENQAKFDETFTREFVNESKDVTYVTAIFARLLQEDLNILLKNGITVTFNSNSCVNTPCKDFVERGLKIIDSSTNVAFINGYKMRDGTTGREYIAKFLATVFNNITVTAGEKFYALYNFKTAEIGVFTVNVEYTLEPINMELKAMKMERKVEYQALPSTTYNQSATYNQGTTAVRQQSDNQANTEYKLNNAVQYKKSNDDLMLRYIGKDASGDSDNSETDDNK